MSDDVVPPSEKQIKYLHDLYDQDEPDRPWEEFVAELQANGDWTKVGVSRRIDLLRVDDPMARMPWCVYSRGTTLRPGDDTFPPDCGGWVAWILGGSIYLCERHGAWHRQADPLAKMRKIGTARSYGGPRA